MSEELTFEQADPALKAEFLQTKELAHDFFCWLRDCERKKLQTALGAIGVPDGDGYYRGDAFHLASLSPETRARLLLDGKSIP